MKSRHFPFAHPTFGTLSNPKSSSHWKKSVYYWWFEYLLRNEKYKLTCKNNGIGECGELFKLFGDVTSTGFKHWWTKDNRGVTLFAEPLNRSIVLINTEAELSNFSINKSINLNVPLDLPINQLVNYFRKIVSKHHKNKKGTRSCNYSKAKFIPSKKIDVKFLEIALMVWDEKQNNTDKPFWQISQEMKLNYKNLIRSSDTPAVITDKKNVLAATASRYYKKATDMIELTTHGCFPNKK
jgi:hypothetical protein